MALPLPALLQFALYAGVIALLVKPLGLYIACVFSGRPMRGERLFAPLERLIYRVGGIDPSREMGWQHYMYALLAFSALGFLLLYALLLLQGYLPLNPQHFQGLSPDLAFNTAASFLTNTDWQAYSGETTMSYFSQMAGLTVQNFLSPAAGLAVLVALIRGFSRKNTDKIGNFWCDVTRAVLYILLPLALIWAVALGSQGVVQSVEPYAAYAPLQAHSAAEPPLIALGPVASQEAIKQLGTNGGGFFNANSAHPFENPTPLSNFLEMLAILLIPAALCYSFGRMVGDTRQGWAILAAMAIIFIPLALACAHFEAGTNPQLAALPVDQSAGNMEGKELRFGTFNSALWAAATTAASNGSVNAAHDSFTPLGGAIPLFLMMTGEVVFGGVGSGLYGMLVFVLLSVFIAGLMVGRTPEYLGKKIQAFEIKMTAVAMLAPLLAALTGTAIAVLTASGQAGAFNPGAQGFSEILYAFVSAANNNGSALAGLSANTPFYNVSLGLAMLVGRFWIILPILAVAGSLAQKNTVPPSAGTLPTHTPLFIAFVIGVVVMVGVLTYVPALALGPVAEYVTSHPHLP